MNARRLDFDLCLIKRLYEAEMSRQEFARAADIQMPQLRAYLRGGAMPRLDTAYRMAKVLGLSLDELVKEWNE